MTTDQVERVALGQGSLDEMAALVEASWAENVEPGFAHDRASLLDLGASDGEVLARSVGLREGTRLVGVLLGLPRRAFVLGEPRRQALVTELTVAAGCKGRGLGRALLATAFEAAAGAGDDVVLFAVPGSAADRAVPGAARQAGVALHLVQEIAFLRGLPRATPGEAGVDDDAGAAGELLAREWSLRAQAADLARTGDEIEARREALRRDAVVARLHAGSGEGAVVGRLVRLPGGDACLVVDESCWGDLAPADRVRLARGALSLAARRGARLCSVALVAQDAEPWRAAGLRLSPRRMNAWLATPRALDRAPRTLLYDVT